MTGHNRLQAIYLQAIYSLVGVIVLLSTLCLVGALLDPADALTKLKVDLSDTHPCQQHVSTEGVCLDVLGHPLCRWLWRQWAITLG